MHNPEMRSVTQFQPGPPGRGTGEGPPLLPTPPPGLFTPSRRAQTEAFLPYMGASGVKTEALTDFHPGLSPPGSWGLFLGPKQMSFHRCGLLPQPTLGPGLQPLTPMTPRQLNTSKQSPLRQGLLTPGSR